MEGTDFDFESRCVSVSNRDVRMSCSVGDRPRISHERFEGRCGVDREKSSRRLFVVSHLWQPDRVIGSEHGNCMLVIEAQSVVWYDG